MGRVVEANGKPTWRDGDKSAVVSSLFVEATCHIRALFPQHLLKSHVKSPRCFYITKWELESDSKEVLPPTRATQKSRFVGGSKASRGRRPIKESNVSIRKNSDIHMQSGREQVQIDLRMGGLYFCSTPNRRKCNGGVGITARSKVTDVCSVKDAASAIEHEAVKRKKNTHIYTWRSKLESNEH